MQKSPFLLIGCIALLLFSCTSAEKSEGGEEAASLQDGEAAIEVWYGNEQYFGQNGIPQRWVNVLGNIPQPDQWEAVVFTVNGGEEQALTLGTDLHRLALNGDFNIEISWDDLREGKNKVVILAKAKEGEDTQETVTLHVEKGNKWVLPYSVDFSSVDNLQQVVQIVDGNWELTDDGVRTVQHWYDRVLSMGDSSWKDYATIAKLTVHGFAPSEKGPPTYGVTHFGLALRWRGHTVDGRQPSRQWYPLGSQGEFLLKDDLDSCQWRILFHGGKEATPPVYSDKRNGIKLGQPFWAKAEVQTLPNGNSQYRYKQWADSEPEPSEWDVSGTEPAGLDYPSGATCLVPHNSDVTIHQVEVRGLE